MARKVKEEYVKKKVRQLLKEAGAWYCMPVGGPYGRRGVPDFLACLNGRLLGIETKAGNNKPTELQKLQLRAIHESGGLALLVNERSLDTLRDLLLDMRRFTHRSVLLYREMFPSLYVWDR